MVIKILRNTLLFCLWLTAAIRNQWIIPPTFIILIVWLLFRTYIIRAWYYLRIRFKCIVKMYGFKSNFFMWVFSSFDRPDPEMFIKKDREILSVKNYGYRRKNVVFTFHTENTVKLSIPPLFVPNSTKVARSMDKLFTHEEHVIPSINTFKVYERFDGRYVRDIVVFCPRCLSANGGETELYKGDKLFKKYEVYNIKSFIKMCL